MMILGGIIMAVGAFLLCGNVFHFFHTIPFAGTGTLILGRIIMRAGR